MMIRMWMCKLGLHSERLSLDPTHARFWWRCARCGKAL